jgi:mono/diheme cytochrome c family protein
MRFLRDAVVTIGALLIVTAVIVYAAVARGGLSADERPGAIERSIARRLVRLSIPPDAHDQANPYGGKTDTWRDAADHFADHCAVCHGADGRGRTEIGAYMYPQVPDLADPAIQQMKDGDLFYIIQNGVRWTGMPGWKKEHTPEDTWKLVSFVRRVPSLTADDLESMAHGEESQGAPHHHDHK